MQPEMNQTPPVNSERAPAPPVNIIEQAPPLPPLAVEGEGAMGRFEQVAEARAVANDISSPAMPILPGTPLAASSPQPTQVQPAGQAPVVAADEDLIEKEWVEKAKQVVENTKDDPHARTLQVSELKEDYIKKRHNRVIGAEG